ncbi:MAG: GGDEF domain-containing protein [Planctomycetota bacterium]
MPNSGAPGGERSSHDETDADRLRGILAHDALSVALVSAFAGDRPLTAAEESLLADLREGRGELFFSDLLYAITHQYFPPEAAENLWGEILRHKYEMSKALNRNAQIIVAALDYLANLRGNVRSPTLINEEHIAEIVEDSMHDGLTGLFNLTSCYEILDLQLKTYARHGTVVSLILLDIDDFKAVNDQGGHQEGDRALRELATAIQKASRESDVCCRYGGEEFAVILPMTNARGAAEIAERIREGAMGISAAGRALAVSAGVAACGEDTTSVHALVEKADRALYRAKKNGKNQVVLI